MKQIKKPLVDASGSDKTNASEGDGLSFPIVHQEPGGCQLSEPAAAWLQICSILQYTLAPCVYDFHFRRALALGFDENGCLLVELAGPFSLAWVEFRLADAVDRAVMMAGFEHLKIKYSAFTADGGDHVQR